MFKSNRIRPVALRLTAALVVGSFALAATATPTEAQALSGGGKIYAVADCYLATNTAPVSVTVMNPSKFSTSGLVYYVKLWAKGSWETNWTLIKEAQTGTIKTWQTINSYTTMNNPTRIFTGSFTGAYNGSYDIYIQYWYKTPTATTWTSMYGFNVSADPDSHISVVSNDGFGNLWSETGRCTL